MELLVNGACVTIATGGRAFDPTRPCIVFLHGAGMDHTCWTLPARWFAWHGWSVLAPDLPGHGRSTGAPLASVRALADWVAALLDAAKIERAALVGHSMGGAIALEAAASQARISGIALIGTAAAIPVSEALLTAARDKPDTAYALMTEWAHGAAARVGGNRVPGIWMTGAARAVFARNAPGVLLTDLTACAAWSSGPAAAAAITCPTLIMMGAGDVMTPPKRGAALAQLIAGSRSITLSGSGHMMMSEAPDACLDALIGHFSGASGAD